MTNQFTIKLQVYILEIFGATKSLHTKANATCTERFWSREISLNLKTTFLTGDYA